MDDVPIREEEQDESELLDRALKELASRFVDDTAALRAEPQFGQPVETGW